MSPCKYYVCYVCIPRTVFWDLDANARMMDYDRCAYVHSSSLRFHLEVTGFAYLRYIHIFATYTWSNYYTTGLYCAFFYVRSLSLSISYYFLFLLFFFFFPSYSLYSPFFLSFLVVPQIRGHIAGSSPPLPTTVRALHFYREKIAALCSLVESRRIVLTHARRSQHFSLSFFIFANKLEISPRRDSNSRTNTSGIRGLPLVHRGDRLCAINNWVPSPICFCNPSGVSDILTESSAN